MNCNTTLTSVDAVVRKNKAEVLSLEAIYFKVLTLSTRSSIMINDFINRMLCRLKTNHFH